MQPAQVTAAGAAAPDRVRGEDVFLASIAGYVDTLGFVALFGLFTAHVTGNFILIGSGLAGVGQGLMIKWLAFPAFIAGIVAARVLDHWMRVRGHGVRARSLYALQTILLAGFMLAGVAASPIGSADAPATIVCGLLGAAAMGVQNAHGRLTARTVVANTVMTGNVTQAVIDAFDWLVPIAAPAEREAARARLRRTLPPVVGFALGAGAGASAYVYAGFWTLVLPLAALGFLTWRSGRTGEPSASR
ncbi:YoaK family protein [Burkholderia cenocepacia]|uniref:YoaK family protein n=1 Tax=Burkholderia cenocepacia TaxID=95486 RepID=UPI002AB73875|nr:YoaK family protein [Burkholderia cenocepacia]